jgi:catechol 2,3-dioxygenase-like lactoylglutathione lyase family enzyme
VEVLSSRVLLRPHDFEASLRFYTEVIGLRVYREYGAGGRVTGTVLFLGGGFLELLAQPGDHGGPLGAGDVSLWLQVPDVDVEHERLAGLGVTVVAPPETKPWGLRECWVADPDGLALVLVEVPEDHPLRRRL